MQNRDRYPRRLRAAPAFLCAIIRVKTAAIKLTELSEGQGALVMDDLTSPMRPPCRIGLCFSEACPSVARLAKSTQLR